MNNIKIKETYLLFLIVIGLVSLALYSTYALFTTTTEIENVVDFSASLTVESGILEYELVTLMPSETKIIELNINNNFNQNLYYGAWYEVLSPSDTLVIEIGLHTEKNTSPSSGTIAANSSKTLIVGITNNATNEVTVKVGTVGSLTSNLGLSDERLLLPEGWSETIIVTDEVLVQYASTKTETTTTTNPVNLTYSYKGSVESVTLNPGTYKLEVWGAQGGSYSTTYYGGKGGYSYGTLTLTEETDIFVKVGGQGTGGTTTGTKSGGYNGGGASYASSSTYAAGSGGGASDIRIDTNKDGTGTLYERVIVAGGGGGAGSYSSTSSTKYIGGVGGGTSGGKGKQYSTSYNAGTGGTATAGGTSYNGTSTLTTNTGVLSDFGIGGGDLANKVNGLAGGGGGWYGGGAGRRSSGGGGLGYVYTSSTASNCPSGCLLTSKYYLTNAATVAGSSSFTDYSGSTVTGHEGDGNAKITGTEQITTQVEKTVYSIPRLLGLTNLSVMLGNSVDLTSGVTIECAEGETGCSIVSTPNIDTSTLEEGTYTVYYVIKDSKNVKYKYPRIINVRNFTSPSEITLYTLNLNSLLKEGTPDFSVTATTDEGIYAMEDDLGTSYYFRGASEYNYVYFAGLYWRIIRINGDGTIRMIYDGTSAHINSESSDDRVLEKKTFNNTKTSNTYVGYMYGSSGSTYEQTHSNTTDSVIKTYLEDTFYALNLKGTSYEQYIADAIYCNDRTPDSRDSSYTAIGTTQTQYDAIRRNSLKTPTLLCGNKNDRFTMNNSTLGPLDGKGTNKKLEAPIGLLTLDEAMLAGGTSSTNNQTYYLYSGISYWTMSPAMFGMSTAREYYITSTGKFAYLNDGVIDSSTYVKPVISLKMDAIKLGNGKIDSPFKVET